MKIQEIYRSGVTDNEDLGEHGRTAATITANVSFAHEQGLENAFAQLLGLEQFKQQLEQQIGSVVHRAIQDAMKNSQLPPGEGWTDDFEVDVSVSPRETSSL